MSAQLARSIAILGFLSVLLVSCAAAVLQTAVLPSDCLTNPTFRPPHSHWYYRTDPANQRKCWYLRPDRQASVPPSLASFKEFMAQRATGTLSDQDVERLYDELMEWRQGAKN